MGTDSSHCRPGLGEPTPEENLGSTDTYGPPPVVSLTAALVSSSTAPEPPAHLLLSDSYSSHHHPPPPPRDSHPWPPPHNAKPQPAASKNDNSCCFSSFKIEMRGFLGEGEASRPLTSENWRRGFQGPPWLIHFPRRDATKQDSLARHFVSLIPQRSGGPHPAPCPAWGGLPPHPPLLSPGDASAAGAARRAWSALCAWTL